MKRTFRKMLSRTTVAALAVAMVGFGASAAQAQDKAPITIATLLDFTAVYTFVSVEYNQGQQDYIKMINMTGGINGHPVKMIIKDTASQPQKGIALYNQAVQEGAVFVDFLSTPVSTAMIPRVLKDHIPMITMLHGQAAASSGTDFPYVFIASPTYWSQAARIMEYIANNQGGLEGKNIAYVYIDSGFGREPIALLQELAKDKGFNLKTFPYPSPGTEQSAVWTKVRRFQPDDVLIWGAGPGQAVSIKQAIRNGISVENIYSVVWLNATDMKAVPGKSGAGVHRVTAVGTGTDYPVIQKIEDTVIKADKGSGPEDKVGSSYYNIGVASMALFAQAAKNALDEYGAPLTGEKLQKGFETLKDFDANGLMPAVTVTAEDHQGGGQARISKWDGEKWVAVSDWDAAYQDIVWKLVKEDAAKWKKAHSK